jgi:hypothetical protein
LVRIEDSESGALRVVDFSSAGNVLNPRIKQLREQMLDCSVDLIELVVGEDCVSALAQFFKSRQRLVADETGG